MPIALGSGRMDAYISGVSHYAPQGAAAAARGGSSSAERGSDSRLAAVLCEEAEEGDGEEGDGEVQSSYRGPLETMDALQDALPRTRRREVPKLYNSKSSSLVNAADDLLSPQPAKGLASPQNPSPKKRKGLLPFSINQNELKSKILSPFRNVTDSSVNYRKPFYPAVSSPFKSRSNDEHECCKILPCHCLERRFGDMDDMDIVASQPVALQNPFISVETRYVSTGGLQDVAESIDDVSPREKRRKN